MVGLVVIVGSEVLIDGSVVFMFVFISGSVVLGIIVKTVLNEEGTVHTLDTI